MDMDHLVIMFLPISKMHFLMLLQIAKILTEILNKP